jgi:hypothetical protein
MPIKTIFHVADLHIHHHNYAHIRHAWEKLMMAIVAVPDWRTSLVLVIAGDVFDHKTWLSADDISLFYELMAALERNQVRTIMMPGNHDYNINNYSGDKILALTHTAGYKFITHVPTSQVVIIDNIAFFVHSPIDMGIPRPGPEHARMKKIAMVHEPLSNSRTSSGVTFCQQRFSAADFSNVFDMTMLGDIHMPQLLARNVAYAGSFVQKTRDEDLAHGYMCWDIATNGCTFVEIPQLSLHIRVTVKDNTAAELPDVKARSLRLYHSGCSEEWLSMYSTMLVERYGMAIEATINKSIFQPPEEKVTESNEIATSVTSQVATVVRPSRFELDRMVYNSMATWSGLNDDIRARITNMHVTQFDAVHTPAITDWRIRFLGWSNMYCYGEDNYVNFDNFANLSSIIGPNKTGKSSIIDILVLVLFNEVIRGSKKTVLNASAKTGHIKCIFTVANDTYAIERAWFDPTTTVAHLYRNGTNISGTDMANTYARIEGIIGSKRIFINSVAALQHRQFLVDLSPKERYELVCRMMDLDRLRAIEDENKAQMRMLRRDIDGHKIAEELPDAETKLANQRATAEANKATMLKLQARIKAIAERKAIIAPDIIRDTMSLREIAIKTDALEKYAGYSEDNETRLRALEPELAQARIEYSRYKFEHDREDAKRVELMLAFNATPKTPPLQISQVEIDEAAKIDVCALGMDLNECTKKRDHAEAEVARMRAELAELTKKTHPSSRSEEAILADIATLPTDDADQVCARNDQLGRQIRAIEATLAAHSGPEAEPTPMTSIEEISLALSGSRADLTKLNSRARALMEKMMSGKSVDTSSLQWADGCQACAHNKAALSGASELIAEHRQVLGQIDVTELMIASLLASARQHYANELETVKRACLANSELLVRVQKRGDLERELANARVNKRADYLRASIDDQRSVVAANESALGHLNGKLAMVRAVNAYSEQRAAISKRAELERRLNEANDAVSITGMRVTKVNEIINRIEPEVNRLIEWRAKSAELAKLTEMFEAVQMSEAAAEEMAELDVELAKLTDALEKCSLASIDEAKIMGKLEEKVANARKSVDALVDLHKDMKAREVYDGIISHKKGVPVAMMSNMCASIEKRCNDFLKEITDFAISISYGDEIHINVRSANGTEVSAEQSSGYQKFILDIVMRQAMCTLMMSSHPRILFIDEGFGSADEDNFRIICAKVLPALAKSFEKVIIISHIMGIHDHTGANCPIGIINGHSRIQFGSVYPGGRDMTIFADHEKHTTALAEVRAKEKAESKAAKDAKKKETDAQQAKLADEKTASFGESIVERVDDKNVRCKACNRIYKLTDGFVAKHIKTDAHRKKLLTYE